MSINYREFIHPDDEAARRQLEEIPGFNALIKYFLELGLEKYLHVEFMANHIRLSPTQLPEIYNLLTPICEKFQIDMPEFYLSMDPYPNAFTTGNKQTFLVVTSGLLEYLKEDEVQAVLAHECGHIVCKHVFYKTVANYLMLFAGQIPLLGDKLILPINWALNYWSRRSEFSADRAEIVYTGDVDPAIRVLVRLAGGSANITDNINVKEYASQAQECKDLGENSKFYKAMQKLAAIDKDHPANSVRVHELIKWANSDNFKYLHNSLLHLESDTIVCMQCGKSIASNSKFCRYCGAPQSTNVNH